jgi:hypothetical protein
MAFHSEFLIRRLCGLMVMDKESSNSFSKGGHYKEFKGGFRNLYALELD